LNITVPVFIDWYSVLIILTREWDGIAPAKTIFASNTSSLPIAEIASATSRLDRWDSIRTIHALFLIDKEHLTVMIISVADPDHFDADPDPTPEKSGCGSGSDHALYKILYQDILALKWPIRLIC
jgi:3-hydroxyacyl-CoA dehydrogenase, NAD binding domain